MNTAPVSAAKARAASSACVRYSPWKRTSAPYPRVALTFGMGAPSGMNTVTLMPSIDPARATPWAWLPAEAATTPAARSASPSRDSRT